MRLLYIDCFSGASGDMLLGALIDAGVPIGEVRAALGSLAVDPEVVWTDRVTRAGIRATKFCVRGEAPHDRPAPGHAHAAGHTHRHDGEHTHAHAHGEGHSGHGAHEAADPHREWQFGEGAPAPAAAHHHGHRSLSEIGSLLEASALSAAAKRRARDLFTTLGEAEAAIHGTTMENVHLHEVGALDSIIDIVGTVFAMEYLGIARVVASPLNVGSGTIRSAHGVYPVPAPATLRLLRGVPIYAGTQVAELVTPTGALLVSGYASAYGAVPPMRVDAIGYGAGTRDFVDTPNVLRVLLGDADEAPQAQRVVVLETEIDDMNPQIFGPLMDRLLVQGALDVFYTPVQMKKNRPGTLLTAIAPPHARAAIAETIFRETTTIGVRYREMDRECLAREQVDVETPIGPVRVKVARRNGDIMNVSPEFDDCVRLADAHGRPVKEVQALALKAFFDRIP